MATAKQLAALKKARNAKREKWGKYASSDAYYKRGRKSKKAKKK